MLKKQAFICLSLSFFILLHYHFRVQGFLYLANTEQLLVLHPHSSHHSRRERMGGLLSSSSRINVEDKAEKKVAREEQKRLRQEKDERIQDFVKLALAESYITYPVRFNTIEAATLYPSRDNSPTLMPGSHKHLGGAYDPTDGCIYGVPANSRAILCMYPDKDNKDYKLTSIPLPESIAHTSYKWLRGIIVHGYLWAIPSWADRVLCVDIDAFWGRRENDGEIVKLIDLPSEHPKGMRWQWHGAGLNIEKTGIYCIPSNSQHVLKVDITTKTTSLIPIDYDPSSYPNFKIDFTNKFYGGILGDDNAVYGVPYRSCAVLRIDCNNDTASLIGPDFGVAEYNWHGGIKLNGKIFAHPSHAPDTVLVIDTAPGIKDNERCREVEISRADYDTDSRKNYKWLGGSVGADGCIYCPPCDTSAVLRIDPITERCTTFGFTSTDRNKWQGGILGRDGCVYCIPADGNAICRIYTNTLDDDIPNPVQLLGPLPQHKDKWQGGHCGKDGSLYFVPENGYRVMKVTPPANPPSIVNGKLPENDVKIEYL